MSDNISSVLWDSAILLGVGMSVVFVFLTILILAINVIEWACKLIPETEANETPAPIKADPTSQAQASVSPQVVAAISAAVHQHRQKN